MAMRIRERDHAHVITVINGGHARERPTVVPVHGKMIGQHEINHAAAQSDEDRLIAG